MKEVKIIVYELSKDEVKALPDGNQVLVYNSIMDTYRIEYTGKKCIAHSKYLSEWVKFFVFDKIKKNPIG